MQICPKCEKETKLVNGLCEHCGVELRICQECGNAVVKSQKFCDKCGSEILTKEEQEKKDEQNEIESLKQKGKELTSIIKKVWYGRAIISSIFTIVMIIVMVAGVIKIEPYISTDRYSVCLSKANDMANCFKTILISAASILIFTVLCDNIFIIVDAYILKYKLKTTNFDIEKYLKTVPQEENAFHKKAFDFQLRLALNLIVDKNAMSKIILVSFVSTVISVIISILLYKGLMPNLKLYSMTKYFKSLKFKFDFNSKLILGIVLVVVNTIFSWFKDDVKEKIVKK